MSQIARVRRLWWNVDFSCGHLKMNIAVRLPNSPRQPMIGMRYFSSRPDQVLNRFSGQEQLAGSTLVVGIESIVSFITIVISSIGLQLQVYVHKKIYFTIVIISSHVPPFFMTEAGAS